MRTQDLVWLLLFAGLAATSQSPDPWEIGLLAALAAVQIVEPAVNFLNTTRRRVLWIILKLLLGYLLAFVLVTMERRWQRLLLFALLIPFWLSVLVRAFAWLALLRSGGVVNGALIGIGVIEAPLRLVYNEIGVTIGMVHYMTPYAVFVLYAQMQGIDRRLCDAARGLGARSAQIFRRVWLPLSLPGIGAAAILIFIFSLGFYVTPTLLGAGKTIMVAEYINVQVSHTLRWGVATALATVLLVTVGLLVFVLSRVIRVDKLLGTTA